MIPLNLIRRFFVLAGVFLFVGTFVFPFMSFEPYFLYIPEYGYGECVVEFWSFMRRDPLAGVRYFSDYWFRSLGIWMDFRDDSQKSVVENEIAWTLIALFAVQTLTLTAAITSIFYIDRKILYLMPGFSCLITALLMASTLTRLNQTTWNKFHYKLGYWLTYPSEALFITNTLITVLIKAKTAKPHKQNKQYKVPLTATNRESRSLG